MKGFIKKLLREGLIYESLITEGIASEFTTSNEYDGFNDNIYYRTIINGIKYEVSFIHSPKSDEKTFYGEYTGMFNTIGSGSKDSGQHHERLGKDLKHFNDVMTTVGEIIKDAVKKFKIRSLKFSGEADKDRDKDISGIDLAVGNAYTTRTKYYVRFFKNLFPDAEIKMLPNNVVKINMVSAMPEYFEEENDKLSVIRDLIDELSELFKEPELDKFEMDGLNTDNYSIKYYGDSLETFDEIEFWLSYSITQGFSVELTIDGEDIDVGIYEDNITYTEVLDRIRKVINRLKKELTSQNGGDSNVETNEDDLKLITNALKDFGSNGVDSKLNVYNNNKITFGDEWDTLFFSVNINENSKDYHHVIQVFKRGNQYLLDHIVDYKSVGGYHWDEDKVFNDVRELLQYILIEIPKTRK